jgi:hypothetical protein
LVGAFGDRVLRRATGVAAVSRCGHLHSSWFTRS